MFDIVCKLNLISECVNLAAVDEDYDRDLDLGEEANETEDGGILDIIEQSCQGNSLFFMRSNEHESKERGDVYV